MYVDLIMYSLIEVLKWGEGGGLVFHYHLDCIYYLHVTALIARDIP